MTTLLLALAFAEPPLESPDGLDGVVRALSMKHAQPCSKVEAETETPVATLRHVVDHVELPPWAPMRAAECLQRNHALEVRQDLLRWVTDPALKGLGRQTVGLLGELELELAVEVGQAALEGPNTVRARTTLEADARPEVRALVSEVPR